MFAPLLANAAGLYHSCVCIYIYVCVVLHLDTAEVCGGTVANIGAISLP